MAGGTVYPCTFLPNLGGVPRISWYYKWRVADVVGSDAPRPGVPPHRCTCVWPPGRGRGRRTAGPGPPPGVVIPTLGHGVRAAWAAPSRIGRRPGTRFTMMSDVV